MNNTPGIRPIFQPGFANGVLQKEKKALIADIQGQSTWKELGKPPLEMELIVSGYSLIDPETGQIIKVNLRYAPQQQSDDYFETRYSAEIE